MTYDSLSLVICHNQISNAPYTENKHKHSACVGIVDS